MTADSPSSSAAKATDRDAELAALQAENPWTAMLRLALPTVATMASYTVMQFADAVMVARIGDNADLYISAQGNGGVWAFIPMSIVLGFTGVINTYVSQNLGAGRPERGPAYAWNALWIAFFAWLFVLLPLAAIIPSIFNAMHGPAPGAEPLAVARATTLVTLESHYAQILLLGGFISMATRAMAQFFYGLHKPSVTLGAAIVGNLTNLFLNWVLIYGNLGAPALGVAGAAIATVIGTAVEASIPLAVFLSARYHRLYATRSAWRLSLPHIKDILRVGWPPALMFGNEIICWALFMTYFAGRFGTDHNAAGWIVLRYMHLSFMPAVGLSFACTAMVGKCLGAGRPDLAANRAKVGIAIAMVYMGLCAALMVIFRHPLVEIFITQAPGQSAIDAAHAASILAIAANIMIVAAVFQVFDALGITLIGVLRGAGDTVWPGVATMILAWVCIVGLGAASTYFFPHWQSLGPWAAAALYIIALGIALAYRFASGAWRNVNLLQHSAAANPAH